MNIPENISLHSRHVGIFGGSFNPIHLGHVALADSICRCGIVDEIWFMVSPLNPLKKDVQSDILPTDLRLKLAEMALKDYENLKVSDVETRLPIPSYTINTLEELHKEFDDCNFKLVLGQDNWTNFNRWVQADNIKASHDIIVYGRRRRPDFDVDGIEINQNLLADVVVYQRDGSSLTLSNDYQFRLFDISSTQIRDAFKVHNLPFAAKWLNEAVFRFILENGLYL